ncbi:hypothetical protein HanPI659440_Chr10g0394121 [Helianthus annuus]|nr:hypothetical protein HanPI659440_Chr10g0394121 [Helianthus annuus]
MRSHTSNPFGPKMNSLTQVQKKMNISMRLAPHHMTIFVTTREASKQSPHTMMRPTPHLAYFLITSRRRGNFRRYRMQRCGSHRTLHIQQVD